MVLENYNGLANKYSCLFALAVIEYYLKKVQRSIEQTEHKINGSTEYGT